MCDFQQMRSQQKFFTAISSGGPHDKEKIKHYLEKDPKKHMYETNNPQHMVNCENSYGLRPLYIACLHGHLEVIITWNNNSYR
jgi:hypothetical protein